jgi:hypothetical protein
MSEFAQHFRLPEREVSDRTHFHRRNMLTVPQRRDLWNTLKTYEQQLDQVSIAHRSLLSSSNGQFLYPHARTLLTRRHTEPAERIEITLALW